jgi:hypothetical protein
MPSKNGFGNSRTPLNKKAQYGVDQKNPIMMKSPAKFLDFVAGDKTTTRGDRTNVRANTKTKITGDKSFSLLNTGG